MSDPASWYEYVKAVNAGRKAVEMPSFWDDDLTDEQQSEVAAFLVEATRLSSKNLPAENKIILLMAGIMSGYDFARWEIEHE